jgi:hypothetical protein
MRVKVTMEIRIKSIGFYKEGIRSVKEIGETYNISERTARRWAKPHNQDRENRLQPKKDVAKDVSLGNTPAIGTANDPTQREISGMGCMLNQVLVQLTLYQANRS